MRKINPIRDRLLGGDDLAGTGIKQRSQRMWLKRKQSLELQPSYLPKKQHGAGQISNNKIDREEKPPKQGKPKCPITSFNLTV